jgi:hypothetical protein
VYSGNPTYALDLAAEFDWGLAHNCVSQGTCDPWQTLRAGGWTIWLVEIGDASTAGEVCPTAATLGFDVGIKSSNFDAFRASCP